jgi:hypothetical protein
VSVIPHFSHSTRFISLRMQLLPFDLVVRIASFLTIEDLLVLYAVREVSIRSSGCTKDLKQTSKALNIALKERSVWRNAVENLLTIVPSPTLSRQSPSLSARELRRVGIRAVSLDHRLRSSSAKPHV